MATLRDALLPALDSIRTIPGLLGIRRSALTIVTRTWSGGRKGVGTSSDVSLGIFPGATSSGQNFHTRQITTREVSESGGRYEIGDLIVEHITPSNGAGVGYTEAQLAPTETSDGIEIIYVIAGQHAGEYFRRELRSVPTLGFSLVLGRRAYQP